MVCNHGVVQTKIIEVEAENEVILQKYLQFRRVSGYKNATLSSTTPLLVVSPCIISDRKFIVIEDLTDEDAPRVSYNDLGADGVVTPVSDQEELQATLVLFHSSKILTR